jgi:DNA-binding MarR family transcriptional regulator
MPEPFDRDVLVLVHDVARQIRVQADRRARAHGTTRAQWIVLARLDRQPGLSQNELAAIAEVEPITIARLIDRLEKRGLVERRTDPHDRRVWRLHLTPIAAPLVDEIHDYREELNRMITQGMKPADIEAVVESLLRMKANLSAANGTAEQAA